MVPKRDEKRVFSVIALAPEKTQGRVHVWAREREEGLEKV